MIISRYIIIVLFYFFAITSLMAQSSDDFGIWTNIEIEKKINKKWTLDGEVEFRTRDNSSEINRWGLKLGGNYSIIKEIKVGLAYQFIYFHDIKYSDFQPRHRFIGFFQGKLLCLYWTLVGTGAPAPCRWAFPER